MESRLVVELQARQPQFGSTPLQGGYQIVLAGDYAKLVGRVVHEAPFWKEEGWWSCWLASSAQALVRAQSAEPPFRDLSAWVGFMFRSTPIVLRSTVEASWRGQTMEVTHVGIAWFRPADYQRARALFTDGDGLPRLYSDWLKGAEQIERHVKASGKATHRAIINVETFPAWCEERDLNIDSKARMTFANAVAYSRAHNAGGKTH